MAILNQKSIALGSVVSADFDGGTTYVAIGLTTGFTPPGRPGTEANGQTLAEPLDVPLPGIEGPAEFTFTQFYTPGDAEVEKVDTAFNNRRKPAGIGGGVVSIQVMFPQPDSVDPDIHPIQTFQVNILNIGPEEVSEPNSTFRRAVQCRRITDITTGTIDLTP
jgi:hypothetical protein